MGIAKTSGRLAVLLVLLAGPLSVLAQATLADYERAETLRKQAQGLVYDSPEPASWIGKSHRFWYRKSVRGGHEFIIVDADSLDKRPAFDHAKLASSLSQAAAEKYTALTLPFNTLTFADDGAALEFSFGNFRWKCDLPSYSCKKTGPETRFGSVARPPAPRMPPEEQPRISPDGKYEAFIRNYNLYLRVRETKKEVPLTYDGTEGDYYTWRIQWSPDSSKLATFHTRPGYHRMVHYVESSPTDQLQPKEFSIEYAKPGDVIDANMPALFDVNPPKQIPVDSRLFSAPYSNGQLRWRKDSRAFTFEYNQRGHQTYRVIEVDAQTGGTRALVDEESPTFFCYSGKKYRYDANDGKEIIWMSERDGWNHLYLYDGVSGTVKHQITKGPWVVRGVDKVDEEKRLIWFHASGMYAGKDPYFVHYYRINFDGTGLQPLSETDANHAVSYSNDMEFYVDTYSRVDLPPASELHRTSDRKLLMQVERADIQDLVNSGWKPPEVFAAKGRDGTTDIWGIICRPRNFDPTRKYPVIENIYAGPQGSFVPKSFSPFFPMQALAELGFIVVQIDGMGTSNRSKAFHDVCWKNLGDAGFPDRILWHKAVAARYPYYDISRVGIYGTSAGGQSAMGALLFHPDFYKVAVSNSGCHDNRMDKIWWNEQWMGYPVGPQYAAASNVDNASKLQGKLLLIVGELDSNVDPSSTFQVVNALIKAGKYFDLLVVPGGGHGAGGEYGIKKMDDFFVHNLLHTESPEWNSMNAKSAGESTENR